MCISSYLCSKTTPGVPVLHLFRHRGKDVGACLVQQRAALDQLCLAKPVTVLLQARQRVWCWDTKVVDIFPVTIPPSSLYRAIVFHPLRLLDMHTACPEPVFDHPCSITSRSVFLAPFFSFVLSSPSPIQLFPAWVAKPANT